MTDTQDVQRALNAIAAGTMRRYDPPHRDVIIDTPLLLNFTKDTFRATIMAQGTNFVSKITNGAPVLTIKVADGGVNVVDLLIDGLWINGNGAEGDLVDFQGSGNTSWLYNFSFRNWSLENGGADGLKATGSIFEGFWDNLCCRGNKGNGATLGMAGDGVLSAVKLWNGSMRKNGNAGIELLMPANDVSVLGTYFVENGGPAIRFANGIRAIHYVGMENNQKKAPGGGPAIDGGNYADIRFTLEGGNGAWQTSMMNGFPAQSQVIIDAVQAAHGIGTIDGWGKVFANFSSVPTVNGPTLTTVP